MGILLDKDFAPGDVLLYPTSTKNVLGSMFIGYLQKWFKETSSDLPISFTHISIIAEDPLYEYEMVWPRSRKHLIDINRLKAYGEVIASPDIKAKVIQAAKNHLGEKYNFLDYFIGYFSKIRVHRLCSAWVYDRFYEVGLDLFEDDDNGLVSPDEIAKSKFINVTLNYTVPK